MLIFIDMIRILFFAVILMSATAVKAQTFSESAFKHPHQAGDTGNIPKKWFITKYAGISTGFVAFKGGGGSFLSVPLAVQLNRQLTNNLFAFGSVSVAPSVFRYNMPYQPVVNKNNSLLHTNNLNVSSDARIGVMYISNDKTFSISGSIGVSRSTYNGFSPFNNYSVGALPNSFLNE